MSTPETVFWGAFSLNGCDWPQHSSGKGVFQKQWSGRACNMEMLESKEKSRWRTSEYFWVVYSLCFQLLPMWTVWFREEKKKKAFKAFVYYRVLSGRALYLKSFWNEEKYPPKIVPSLFTTDFLQSLWLVICSLNSIFDHSSQNLNFFWTQEI